MSWSLTLQDPHTRKGSGREAGRLPVLPGLGASTTDMSEAPGPSLDRQEGWGGGLLGRRGNAIIHDAPATLASPGGGGIMPTGQSSGGSGRLSSRLQPVRQVLSLALRVYGHPPAYHPSWPCNCPLRMLQKEHSDLLLKQLSSHRYPDATFKMGAKTTRQCRRSTVSEVN